MNNKKTKIVMITMFKNEAKVIKRMLDSCLPYVDYYVMQDNGSTDGTTDIAKQFLLDNKLSGEIYTCEEGWKGFGWNRDHLIQYCQNTDHECDWILKMDCDEVLEIDDDFDWSILNDTSIPAFHIPAVSGTCIYYRAWMWNATWPWRFNHDPCHETIYCATEGIGENFWKYDLPKSFRQVGYNEGQSWSVPTKFISDSLILEEKMIREGNMLDNIYHFWYIGKSYNDAYPSTSGFPLGHSQQKEYARRTIYYFNEYINHIHKSGKAEFIDETSYMSLIFSAEAYVFLKEYDKAIETYKRAEQFAPERNDHLFGLTVLYQQLSDWKNMYHYTSIMMQPERTNPFPKYCNFIDSSLYYDGGDRIKNLHELAFQKMNENTMTSFNINRLPQKRLFVVDNFYSNPDEIRNFALTQVEYKQDLRWYKGYRSTTHFHPPGIREAFENIIGENITNFQEGINGCFQLMISTDQQVYHYDEQKWAAMIYLSPNAPIESGTRLHQAKTSAIGHKLDTGINEYFNGNFYDSTKWNVTDSIANYYNRLVIMDAQCVHSAGPYFGNGFEDGRLTHLFFFD
jgi:glycosyltransferase involved in cell wall biosynthesis